MGTDGLTPEHREGKRPGWWRRGHRAVGAAARVEVLYQQSYRR